MFLRSIRAQIPGTYPEWRRSFCRPWENTSFFKDASTCKCLWSQKSTWKGESIREILPQSFWTDSTTWWVTETTQFLLKETLHQLEGFFKLELSKPTILALFKLQAETKISADSSSHRLGVVILQKQSQEEWRPIAYASRALTDVERRYAQTEETLASTWAVKKFSNYNLGKRFLIETDHKPLVSLLGNKSLDNLPPRILQFQLRLSRFSYDIANAPGKLMYTADTLSRNLDLTPPAQEAEASTQDVKCFANSIIAALPAPTQRLETFKAAQASNFICIQVIEYCEEERPEQLAQVPNVNQLYPYWVTRNKLTIVDKLILYDFCIVIPLPLQKETLGKRSFQCLLRARTTVWWPQMAAQIKKVVTECRACQELVVRHSKPLIPSQLPTYPW